MRTMRSRWASRRLLAPPFRLISLTSLMRRGCDGDASHRCRILAPSKTAANLARYLVPNRKRALPRAIPKAATPPKEKHRRRTPPSGRAALRDLIRKSTPVTPQPVLEATTEGAELADETDSGSSDVKPRLARRGHRQQLKHLRGKGRLRQVLREVEDRSLGENFDCRSFLIDCAITDRTRQRYAKGLSQFVDFCGDRQPQDDQEMDSELTAYFEESFLCGEMPNHGEIVMAGVMHFDPHFSRMGPGKLPRAWRALRGWQRRAPGRTRRPLPWPVWAGVVNCFAARGSLQMGLFVLMAFTTYARPIELFRLLRKHLVAPVKMITSAWSLLIAPDDGDHSTKTGLRNVSIMLDDVELRWADYLWQALAFGEGSLRLWDFTYAQLHRELRLVCDCLSLSLTLYQTRHSGASHDRMKNNRSLDAIMKRGHWKTQQSVLRYEKSALLATAWNAVPATTRDYCVECAIQLEAVLLGQRGPVCLPQRPGMRAAA